MSYSVNRVELIGRVGRINEAKTVGGKTVVNFSIATSYGKGDQEKTEWHQIAAWEKLADTVTNYVHVGDNVRVEGRISYSTTGEGDTKKTYTQITAYSLINFSPKKADAGSTTGAQTTAPTVAVKEEDIPF